MKLCLPIIVIGVGIPGKAGKNECHGSFIKGNFTVPYGIYDYLEAFCTRVAVEGNSG